MVESEKYKIKRGITMKKIKVILIGAGGRGQAYTDIMAELPGQFEVVGVAEPIEDRRDYIKNKHGIPDEKCFDTWEKILDIPKFADLAVISTMDRMHKTPAIKATELGYDILLEKPAAPTPEDCAEIKKAANDNNVKVMVCHVLRYSPFYMSMKEIVDSGKLGRIMSVNHIESVGNIHQSHSFVRGNWGNSEESSTMLLQKCCHDMDILQWILGKECLKIQSFGSLSHFTEENAPEGAPERCVDGCPYADTCCYNAVKLYYDDKDNSWFRTTSTKKVNPTDEDVLKALKETQYGKCVYKCNNDVVDHQTVNMEFEDSITVTFSMNAFNEGGRQTRIMGTKGELFADWNRAELYTFVDKKRIPITLAPEKKGESIVDGHGGGDGGIVLALYDYLTDKKDKTEVSEIDISFKNHLIVFAAEESRLTGKVIDMKEYKERFGI